MAIRPVNEEKQSDMEPLCALKVGSFNCFCLWTPNGTVDAQTEARLTNGWSQEPGRTHATLPDGEVHKSQEDNTETGSHTTASSSAPQEASNRDGVQQQPAVESPLLSTVRQNLGRHSPIQHELAKLGGDMRNLDQVIFDQVRRVASHYEEALLPAELDPSEWHVLERSGERGLQYGSRNVEGNIHWFRSMECPESDIVKGFAAFLEVDLCGSFIDEFKMAEPLGMHTAKRDSVWRTVIEGIGVKQDNVSVHSAVDALDEPVRSLIVFSSTTSRPPGLLLVPPPHPGFNRADFECTITRLQPLRSGNEQPSGGFRITQTGINRPLGMRGPGSAIPMLSAEELSRKTNTFFTKLSQYLDRANRLDQRMTMSPRTELYDRIRKHLASMPS